MAISTIDSAERREVLAQHALALRGGELGEARLEVSFDDAAAVAQQARKPRGRSRVADRRFASRTAAARRRASTRSRARRRRSVSRARTSLSKSCLRPCALFRDAHLNSAQSRSAEAISAASGRIRGAAASLFPLEYRRAAILGADFRVVELGEIDETHSLVRGRPTWRFSWSSTVS